MMAERPARESDDIDYIVNKFDGSYSRIRLRMEWSRKSKPQAQIKDGARQSQIADEAKQKSKPQAQITDGAKQPQIVDKPKRNEATVMFQSSTLAKKATEVPQKMSRELEVLLHMRELGFPYPASDDIDQKFDSETIVSDPRANFGIFRPMEETFTGRSFRAYPKRSPFYGEEWRNEWRN